MRACYLWMYTTLAELLAELLLVHRSTTVVIKPVLGYSVFWARLDVPIASLPTFPSLGHPCEGNLFYLAGEGVSLRKVGWYIL